MKPKEILELAAAADLGAKELAHLLGVSTRAIRRGVKKGGTVDVLLHEIQAKLSDPQTMLSMRALMIISARGEGLKTLVLRLISAYVRLDQSRAP